MFFSGGVNAEKDVAVVLRNDILKGLTKVEFYSKRLMFVKSAKTVDIVLVQVYMLTYNDDEIENLCDEIFEILHQVGGGQVNAIVMGNFNRIVGEGSTDSINEMRGARCSSTSAINMIW